VSTSAETKRRILIIDDDEDILDLLQYNLVKEGFAVKALTSSSNAIRRITDFRPDLIILDMMMHPFNGIEVCRMIRDDKSLHDVYVFFLTAKSEHYYQQAAYTVGCDEFVEKIVGLKPLMSKVNTVLKDNYVIRKSFVEVKCGPLQLHRSSDTAYLNGNPIALNKHEFDILFFMVQNEGKVIPLRQIVNSLWGSTTFMDENTALTYVDNVRRKVGGHLIEEKRINLFRFGASRETRS
jgi:two-component system, OmpR family, alkaline phosphatase synthesis response regulator PhoP